MKVTAALRWWEFLYILALASVAGYVRAEQGILVGLAGITALGVWRIVQLLYLLVLVQGSRDADA